MSTLAATDTDFASTVLDARASGKTVLVDFWADWCGPCKQVAPVVEQIAAERPDVAVIKVDIDASPATASEFNVMSVPTLLVIGADGETKASATGAKPKHAILGLIDRA